MVNFQKAAIIGSGFVGTSIAFTLMQKQLFSDIVLIDINQKKAEGEAMDLSHGIPFTAPMQVRAGTYDDLSDAALVIVTAGANQRAGETRLDLVERNTEIFRGIIPEISRRNMEAILLIVTNPVDIMTYVAWKLSRYPKERVIGSGTVLDTARLKYLLSRHLNIDSRSVHAFIIGEHGDSELAVWSAANVSGMPLNDFCELDGRFNHTEAMERIYQGVKNSAYEIIERKGATYYGVAMAVGRIAEALFRNEHSILPVSVYMDGMYGLEGMYLSIPSVVGKNGIEKVLKLKLDEDELAKLSASAKELSEVAAKLDV